MFHLQGEKGKMKKMTCILAALGLVFAGSINNPALSGEVDILINKLVEKGILNQSDAKQLITEMQKESARQEDAVKRVASEAATDTAKKEAKAVESKIPKWVQNTAFKGDFRLRYQHEERDDTGNPERDRFRFRWRLGADSKINDQWKAGFRLASGSSDPRSTNQTFEDQFESKSVQIDQAYATYKPCAFASVTGGKMSNPLWEPKDLIWDTDITPEGVAIKGEYEVFPKFKVFWTPAAFILDEFSGDSNDPWMLVLQPGIDWGITDMFALKVAGSHYSYYNVTGNPFNEHSANTNTRVGGNLVEDYDALALFGELGVKLPMSALPYLAVFGEWIESDADDDETAMLAGFKFGHKKVSEFGQWQVVYNYRDIERDAIPDFLPDSDFRGGSTNGKGHEVEVVFGLSKHVTIGLDYYNSELNDKQGGDAQEEDLVQVDMILSW
jgi:polyhydroxyalkanoate synthesis regulator phasin